MTKATRVHSTPRRPASKTKPAGGAPKGGGVAAKKKLKAPANPERSKIIEQCVIYVQSIAAYDAGFTVDHTGDSDYVDNGGQMRNAKRAMSKLIALSSHLKGGATPLTAIELHAKAGVLAAMYGLRKDEQPDPIEQTYIRFFAGEVSDFLAVNHAAS